MAGTGTAIYGTVRLELDSPPLRARLRYFPGSAEEPLTEKGILALLVKRRIGERVDPLTVRAFLRDIEANPAVPHEAVVAEGVPPSPGKPESIAWKDLPIPENLMPVSQAVSARAGAPEILHTRVEKARVQKKQPRKGLLARIRKKEEHSLVTEKRTVTERVDIDPTVLSLGFIRSGEAAADILPPEPGVPGTGVDDSSLPAWIPAPDELNLGPGLERRGLQILARETGFLRRGIGWADLVPYRESSWELSFDPTRSSCYFSLRHGDDIRPLPSGAEIVAKADEQGIARHFLLPSKKIDRLLSEAASGGTDIERLSLTPDRDAFFRITVQPDGLVATLSVRKGQGSGKPLSLKELGEAIRAEKLKRMNPEKVRSDILAFYRSPEPELADYILAAGKPPEREKNSELVWAVEFLPDEEKRQALPHGTEETLGEADPVPESFSLFPLSRIERVALVRKDRKIAELSVPPTVRPGVDVYGNTIRPEPGKEPEVRLFEGLVRRRNEILATADGVLDTADMEGTAYLRIRSHRDGQVSVSLAADRMQAFLSLRRHAGTGRPVDMKRIEEALQAKGVVFGIHENALQDALERLRDVETVENALAAEGTPARNGSSGTFRFAAGIPDGSPVSIVAGGRADFRNRTDIVTVREGDFIAEIIPPEELPSDGCDVTGCPLPACTPQQPDVRPGRHVRQETSESGFVRFFAARDGEVSFENGILEVRNVRLIRGSVDYHCGNLRFPGTVIVSGSVLSGFHVMADGDIQVGEVVQAALLSAEGHIRIAHGIKGARKGILRTKGSIEIGFAEQATLLAVGDIRIRNACMLTQVKCNGRLALSTDRGTIVGGTVRARNGVEAHTLGSETGVHTLISFGQDYLIADQIDLETKEIEKLKMTIAETDARLQRLAGEESRETVDSLRREKLTAMKTMEKRSIRVFALRERFEEHYPSEARVHGTVHPGVVFESHGRTLEIHDPKKAVRIVFNPETGRLEANPLDGNRKSVLNTREKET